MTKEEIQYEAQSIIQEWGSNDSAPYVEFVEKLASMELPEPPSNLDEAANRQAVLEHPYKCEEEQDGSFCVTPLFVMSNIRSAFKAGAEWMAGQGVTKEAVIGMATEEISINVSQQTLNELDICPGDKVIVQIRKK